ncbi:MAG: hypothetical protein J7K40_12525 [candidate division Zixibacteria bacterium]|nr:hypothetical protein [candidate division Zixibacteria bacterium]
MRKLIIPILMITLTASFCWADGSESDFTIAEYFASNALVVPKIINQIPTPETIVVLELKGTGIIQVKASYATEKLRTELYESGEYQVMAREQMNKILATIGFKISGCFDEKCLIQAGQALNVNKIIGGTITFIDSTYTVSTIMVDVESGKIINTASYETQAGLDSVTTVGVRSLAAKLIAIPEIEEPEPVQQTDVKFPVVDTVKDEFAGEDLYTSTLTGDIYEFDAKSTKKAFFYSLLVPGAGEYYAGSKIKPFVFVGIEAMIWTGYFMYDKKGDDKKEEYRNYADDHYEWWTFIQWWNTLDSTEQDTFSHRLPWDDDINTAIKDHEYYENIGKYDQFQYGWDDISTYPPGVPGGEAVVSPHRSFYLDLRDVANGYYNSANTMIMLSLGNHIISAFDAALTAKKFNKGQKRYSLKIKTKDFGSGNIPILTCTYRF